MLAFLLSLVLIQTTGQELDKAERNRFEALLSATPTDASAQEGEVRVSEQLALGDRAAGDFNAAIGDLLRAKRFAPESPRLLYDTGVLEEQIGLFQDAEATVEHLRELLPDEAKTLYLASHIELDLGRLAQAEADMRRYLKLNPNDTTAHYGLGRILQQAQQGPAARIEFERSIELRPAQTEAYYQLGQLDLETGDFEAALREDSRVVARDPKHAGAVTGIGIALFRLKRYPEAEIQLRHAVDIAPNYQLAHYFYGLALGRVGQKNDSARELALAAKLADEANRKDAQRQSLNSTP